MSSTPQLSYKKPSNNSPRIQSTSSISIQGSSESSPSSTPNIGATRKISRRKALQDYYKIENDQREGDKPLEQPDAEKPFDQKEGDESFDHKKEDKLWDQNSKLPVNEDDLQLFLQTSSMEEILKLRNNVSGTQSSQDLEKKEIIYDNYYELIKLNETLSNISNQSLKKSQSSSLIVQQEEKLSDNYVDETLQQLSHFIATDVHKFSDDFRNVLKNLNQHEADDGASVTTIVESEEIIPENVDKFKLLQEINFLLSKTPINQDLKPKLELEIHSILEKLDHKNEELLILQLNDIKKRLL